MRIATFFLFMLCMEALRASTPLLETGIAGLTSTDSLQDAVVRLNTLCVELDQVEIESPSFPLAETSEVHLICRNMKVGLETIESVAITYADGRMAMLYAEGNAAETLLELASEPVQTYQNFNVSFAELLIADKAADKAWLLTAEAAHPNLFQWSNPYIATVERVEYEPSASIPDVLQFSNTLDSLLPAFESQCAITHLGTYDVWLLNQPELQQQVDCFGYEYAGFPRKIEAVFGDGILEQVWILTGKGEEDRIRQALIAEFGNPIFVDSTWEVFNDKRVMLRKDKPEVLMLSDNLAELFYDTQVDSQ